MTERKPPGVTWEAWTERLIREGVDRGEFDALPGRGQPLPGIDRPHDELWWVRDKLAREELVTLPVSLALRRERELLLDGLATFQSEEAVRAAVSELNDRIRRLNRYGAPGPPSTLMVLDDQTVIDRWRTARRTSPDG